MIYHTVFTQGGIIIPTVTKKRLSNIRKAFARGYWTDVFTDGIRNRNPN